MNADVAQVGKGLQRAGCGRTPVRAVEQITEIAPHLYRVSTILRKNPRLIFFHRLTRAAYNIATGKRFDVAGLVERIGTEKHSLRSLKKDARVPAMRQMRRPAVTKSIRPVAKENSNLPA